jgi:hypothetical protein
VFRFATKAAAKGALPKLNLQGLALALSDPLPIFLTSLGTRMRVWELARARKPTMKKEINESKRRLASKPFEAASNKSKSLKSESITETRRNNKQKKLNNSLVVGRHSDYIASVLEKRYNTRVKFPKKEVLEYLQDRENLSESYSKLLLEKIISYVNDLCADFSAAADVKQSEQLGKASALDLPSEAPELYKGNRGGAKGGENIVEFLRRVWQPWIEAGVLTRSDLRRLDRKADEGVANWLRTRELPDDIRIPTKSEVIDMEYGINNLSAEEIKAQMLEHARLGTILRQRLNALERK